MSRYCPNCGEELVDDAKFCKSCGTNLENRQAPPKKEEYTVPVVESDHKIAIIAGYVLAILMPLFGLIMSVYLWTRTSENAKKHAKYILIVSIAIWFLSALLFR